MLSPQEIRRYQRQTTLQEIGVDGQQRLKEASVLIIGAGGLGCPVIQYLAAAGVGTLGIIDHDKVEESNLQRQILFNQDDIGKNKAHCAKSSIQKINPHIEAISYPEPFTKKNALKLCQQFDVIVDGTDNFETKYLINDATLIAGKPMVFASVYKFEGQLSVFNYLEGPSYRCVFPQHHQLDPNNCVDTGVMGILPGLLGILQATETIKIILRIGEVLSGKMKIYNALTNDELLVEIVRNNDIIEQIRENGLALTSDSPEIPGNVVKGQPVYIDVRELHETPKMDHLDPLLIPLSQLKERYLEIPKEEEVIVFCQTGRRSAEAVAYLKSTHGYKYIHSLAGGIHELQN